MLAWRLFQLLTVAALVWAGWRLLGHIPYRIDIDVYRMGGRAWLDGRPLYADGAMFTPAAALTCPLRTRRWPRSRSRRSRGCRSTWQVSRSR